jgi:hypothetical protein
MPEAEEDDIWEKEVAEKLKDVTMAETVREIKIGPAASND